MAKTNSWNMNIAREAIASSKGNLAAVINYPDLKTERLAILCPGYLETKDYAHLAKLAEDLANHDYTVVRFDPTGTWESDGDITEYTTTQYLADVKNVLEYMLRQRDYKRILLGGHSRGGFVAMLYATQDQRISVVLSIMSPYSLIRPSNREVLDNWREKGYRESSRDIPGSTERKKFYVPYAHALDFPRHNLLDNIHKFHGFSIIIAGELDDQVLLEEVKPVFDRANEPKRFTMVQGVGHYYRHSDEEIKIVNEHILHQLGSQR